MDKNYLNISQMAKMHNISRQTLIYYDHIGLFKPIVINDKGYRLYSPYQIPYLREICLLKNLKVPLEDIKHNIQSRDSNSVVALLEQQKEQLDHQIETLKQTQQYLNNRIEFYKITDTPNVVNVPTLCQLPKRYGLFIPFNETPNKEELHLTLIKGFQALYEHNILPTSGFGTLIKKEAIETKQLFKGAGSFINLPEYIPSLKGICTLKEGLYVCMFKYGFPYESEYIEKLLLWIKENGYRVTGDIIDVCVYDTTFYNQEHKVDYCHLEIPVEKI